MHKEALMFFTDTQLTLFALILFVACFAGVLLWINRQDTKELYEYMEHLPLEEEIPQ